MTQPQGFRSGVHDDGTTWVSWLLPDGSRYTASAIHGSTLTPADEDVQDLHNQVTQLQDRVTQQQEIIDSAQQIINSQAETIDRLKEQLRRRSH